MPCYLSFVVALAACSESAKNPLSPNEQVASVQLLRVTRLSGQPALQATIDAYQHVASEPESQLWMAGLRVKARDVLSYLASEKSGSTGQRAVKVAQANNQDCYYQCTIYGGSSAYVYGYPPNSRTVDYHAFTNCSGYPAYTYSSGNMSMRQSYNGMTTFSAQSSYGDLVNYTSEDYENSVSGATQSATLSTQHACQTQFISTPDRTSSSWAGSV